MFDKILSKNKMDVLTYVSSGDSVDKVFRFSMKTYSLKSIFFEAIKILLK